MTDIFAEKICKALKEIKNELQETRKCLEPLSEAFAKLSKGGDVVLPAESGLTGNEMREFYGLKRIEEGLCDKVLISVSLYDKLMQCIDAKNQRQS